MVRVSIPTLHYLIIIQNDMKKFLAIITLIVLAIAPAIARDRVVRDESVLPAEAKTLIKKHFPNVKINHIKIDDHTFGGADYDVILNNGTELDFNSKGALEEIDCGMDAVPASLVPKPIGEFVAGTYPGQKIVSLSFGRSKYEVELSNGTELEYDRNGRFLRIDD